MSTTTDLNVNLIRYDELHGMPDVPVIGSYFGKNCLVARQLYLKRKLNINIPTYLKDEITNCVQFDAGLWSRVPINSVEKSPRIENLPSANDYSWTCHLQVSSQIYSDKDEAIVYSVLPHGWLFGKEIKTTQTSLRCPLIGIFQPVGICVTSPDACNVGINEFRWSAISIDKEDKDTCLRVGADVSKFWMSEEVAVGWMVTIDIESKRVDATYLIIIPYELEKQFQESPSKAMKKVLNKHQYDIFNNLINDL